MGASSLKSKEFDGCFDKVSGQSDCSSPIHIRDSEFYETYLRPHEYRLSKLRFLEQLAKRMKAADEASYDEFAEYFGLRFRGSFLRRGMPPFEAEDLAINCVEDIAGKIKLYHPNPHGFEAWVWTLANNAFFDWYRKSRKTVAFDDRLTSTVTTSEILEFPMELVQAVDAALAQLKPEEQTLIRMRYFEGQCKFEEIGQVLGTTSGATRVRHLRLLHHLAAILETFPAIRKFLKNRQASRHSKIYEDSKSKSDIAS